MMLRRWSVGLVTLFAAAVLILAGCTQGEEKGGQARGKDKATETGDKREETKHSGWWCDEHGVPEAECSMCSSRVAKACKAKGDWCKEHDRAKSQCFICNPALKDEYAAKYRAKYGKEPPPPTDNMPGTVQKEPKKEDK